MSLTREEAIKHITTWMCATSDLPPKQVAQALDMAITALRGPTREMVERMRGEWEAVPRFGVYDTACSKCGYAPGIRFFSSDFCPACGAPMTDEAVDMMLERWKEAVDGE